MGSCPDTDIDSDCYYFEGVYQHPTPDYRNHFTKKAAEIAKDNYTKKLLKFPNPSQILRSSMQSLLLKSYRPNTLYYGERSFAFAAPKLWNSIPEHIKSASSLTTFKTALKTYLFRRHFRDE